MFGIFRKNIPVGSTEPLGIAFKDYLATGKNKKIYLSGLQGPKETSIKVSHFVNLDQGKSMIASKVISLAKGKCLDIGACSGHVSRVLQDNQIQVTALDISKSCTEYMLACGIKEVVCADIWSYEGGKYDTILLIDGTIGCIGTIDKLPMFFKKIEQLLTVNGQVLISDNNFDAKNGLREWEGQFRYNNFIGERFNWFNISLQNLCHEIESIGWDCDPILKKDNGLYLVRITHK